MYKLKNSLVAFLGMSLVIGAIAVVTPRTSFGDDDDDDDSDGRDAKEEIFGIVGITFSQTARLNVVNIATDGRPVTRVLKFVDTSGNVIVDSTGNPVTTTVTLAPGQSAYLDLNGDLIPGNTGRFSVRAVDPTCPGCGRPARGIIQTLEVIDNALDRTELLYAPAKPDGPPIRPAPFGMLGIIGGQTARLSVAFPGDPVTPPSPIRAILSFVKSDGQPVIWDGVPQQTEVTLQPGGSASFDLPADRVLGGQTRAQIRPVLLVPTCPGCRLIPTLEVIDDATGKTAVLYAPAATRACRED